MAYHVYTTEGVVLSGDPQGEADTYYSIFTKDLGLIFAIGKGTRKKESKLASSLDILTHGEFSLVHGKRGWRIIGAREMDNLWKMFRTDIPKRRAVIGVVRTVRMLVAGEEPNPELFAAFLSAMLFLRQGSLSKREIDAWQAVTALRLLSILGYGDEPAYESFLHTSTWSPYLIADAVPLIAGMRASIESALTASDLAHTSADTDTHTHTHMSAIY